MNLDDQLRWDMKYGFSAHGHTLNSECIPYPPVQTRLDIGITHGRVAVIMNNYNPKSQAVLTSGYASHDPVTFMSESGSQMGPTRGFDPTIPSSQQSYQRAHSVAHVGEKELREEVGGDQW